MTIYIIVFLTAFFMCRLATPHVKTLAEKIGAIDYPDRRKIHAIPTARMGGLAIYLGFITAIGVGLLINAPFAKSVSPGFPGFIIGSLIIVITGILDDTTGLKPLTKFMGQFLAATVFLMMADDTGARVITNPFGTSSITLPDYLSFIISMLWIVGIVNAINFIDGLDGLANGISFLAAVTLFVVNVRLDQHFEAFAYLCLMGSCLGFAGYNEYPAKIFMGDTGSHFLGFSLACLGLLSTTKATTLSVLLIPLVSLGLPIFDVLIAVIRRSLAGKNIFYPDRRHIHHRLLEKGFTQQEAVRILYLFCTCLCIVACIFMNVRDEYATLLAILTGAIIFSFSSHLKLLWMPPGSESDIGDNTGRDVSEKSENPTDSSENPEK
ncbi:MAG: undecaprenyl-phosphate alpha-N-acetylglucosaminyl 1-phosphate transferase [Candidatus Wallbacteria bacterium HGW-Wallbacteria-1]|jgi:UDP-GlcNAc:undecaprenyl-phosphate GlcNAc-1-phosphate transferase|uniref:Undecaprenyl-phosphate alpha-N-acetylglucosaminyl 1-phosphate transferase n=1 Tax=Candidatus Wallbacteria bacterium HGW-Wallbacteria-1 TaxID=2013854 RepID=A0A2N1PPI2_9BACT|nr:MAG: undecaprenyl-phosphate alpha-N-acetylglucosaminyl 1-phosphate transferase [Candidatus Wallbacteria bacterium HGW-Wallbacteria-1]